MSFGQLPYDLAHLLGGAVLLLSFVLLYQRRISAVINAFATQGALLALAAAWQGYVQGAAGLYVTAAIAFGAKAVLIPYAAYLAAEALHVSGVLAVVIVTPLLSVYASILGVFGGYLILGPHGFTGAQYMDEVRKALTIGGFLQGLAKAAVFAILVASIGCLAGLRTGQGPGAVGMSTTRAVVAGIVAIVVADSVLGAFFYTLGI